MTNKTKTTVKDINMLLDTACREGLCDLTEVKDIAVQFMAAVLRSGKEPAASVEFERALVLMTMVAKAKNYVKKRAEQAAASPDVPRIEHGSLEWYEDLARRRVGSGFRDLQDAVRSWEYFLIAEEKAENDDDDSKPLPKFSDEQERLLNEGREELGQRFVTQWGKAIRRAITKWEVKQEARQ